MLHTVNKFKNACQRLKKQGYRQTDEQWSDIDETLFEVAQALHPDGSYLLFTRVRTPQQ